MESCGLPPWYAASYDSSPYSWEALWIISLNQMYQSLMWCRKNKFKWQLKISAGTSEQWAPLTTGPAWFVRQGIGGAYRVSHTLTNLLSTLESLCVSLAGYQLQRWIPAASEAAGRSSFLQSLPHTCSCHESWFPNTYLFLLSRSARTEFKKCLRLYMLKKLQHIWKSRTFLILTCRSAVQHSHS